jgi:hypothetical protein
MSTFIKIKLFVANLFAIPGAFIDACSTLAEATDRNTEAVRAMHRELLSPIKGVEQNTKYVAAARKRELQRNGQPHEF